MRTPNGTQATYDVREIDVDGIESREVTCEECGEAMSGSAQWLLGIADRSTHILSLRHLLGEGCDHKNCPHLGAYGRGPGDRAVREFRGPHVYPRGEVIT